MGKSAPLHGLEKDEGDETAQCYHAVWSARRILFACSIIVITVSCASIANTAFRDALTGGFLSTTELEEIVSALEVHHMHTMFRPDAVFGGAAPLNEPDIPLDERAFFARAGWNPSDVDSVYALSVSHQLYCIDFIGNALLQETVNNGWQRQDSGNDGIFHHCIEYLTQTTMCAVDAALEKATIKIDPGSVYRWRPSGVLTNTTMHQCRDIRKVIQFASAHTILGRI